jgi:hypothetical protein
MEAQGLSEEPHYQKHLQPFGRVILVTQLPFSTPDER